MNAEGRRIYRYRYVVAVNVRSRYIQGIPADEQVHTPIR